LLFFKRNAENENCLRWVSTAYGIQKNDILQQQLVQETEKLGAVTSMIQAKGANLISSPSFATHI
jgi:hypothetical protein